jgi:hypothetical protein
MNRFSKNSLAVALAAIVAFAPAIGLAASHGMVNPMTEFDDLEWVPMAEGSPAEISILWGDPAVGPVGLLIRTPVGFVAPMHLHSSDYNAVVIQGMHQHWVEGEDRSAAPILTPGSYFSQVREQVHGDANAGDVPMIGFVYFNGPVDSIAKE